MAKFRLDRLLAQSRVRVVMEHLTEALGVAPAILAADGSPLLGDARGAERFPIQAAAENVGWAAGGPAARCVAEMLSALATAEHDKKELAREGVQKYKELALLHEFSEKIAARLRLPEIVDFVVGEMRRIVPRGDPGLVLLDESAGTPLEPLAGTPAALPGELRTFLAGIMRDSRSEIVNTVCDDARLGGAPCVVAAAMATPLRCNDRTFGALYVSSERPVEFRSEELHLLGALATLCASAMEKSRLYASIEEETRLRASFQRYLSPNVVDDIMANRADIALGGKNVECSILFSDICGFTALAESETPERIVRLLNEYFTLMAQIVFRHGGTLDKFIGDAIMAVFGAPFSSETAHLSAVRVAIEMHQALLRLRWKWQRERAPLFQHRIGINTGPVVAGNIGSNERMDYTVVGDAVNLAARMETEAPPLGTLLSRSTYDRVQDDVIASPMPSRRVKGKKSAVQPYRVWAVRDRGDGSSWWTAAVPIAWHGMAVSAAPQEGILARANGREIEMLSATAPVAATLALHIGEAGSGGNGLPLHCVVDGCERRADSLGEEYHCIRLRLPMPPAAGGDDGWLARLFENGPWEAEA